jgi:hypothetical protein
MESRALRSGMGKTGAILGEFDQNHLNFGTQIPGGRKHGLTGAGGGLQHGLDAGDHRDGGRGERVLSLAKSIANMRFRQDISRMSRIVFDLLA